MARHNIGKVPKALRRVPLRSDVDVHSTATAGVAFRSGMSELPAKLLQGFDVAVGQDRGDQFAFLFFRSCDGNVLLEFPLAPLTVPCAPSAVSVAAGSVLISACAKVGSGNLRGLLPGDIVHFHLNPDSLRFHLCNLPCCFLIHSEILRFFCPAAVCFPFRCTHIRSKRG